jgi:acyl-CoA dehydrogenase
MSEMQDILTDSASRLFERFCNKALRDETERGAWPAILWRAARDAGLTQAGRSEDRGGAGADLNDLAALLKVVGKFAAPIPLMESILAEQMLSAADLAYAEDGPLTVGPCLRTDRIVLEQRGSRWFISGKLQQVPWGRNSAAMAAIATSQEGTRCVLLRLGRPTSTSTNFAGEPRDTFVFDGTELADEHVSAPGAGIGIERLIQLGALYRSLEMTGALQKILDLTVQYAQERVQFGRPIGKFQAVQQQIAVMAAHAAAATAAAQGAVDDVIAGGGAFAIAAAKTRIGQAAGTCAAIAHQVHGAMGFTHEHQLHAYTRRLWSWRDEFGAEREWSAWIGRNAVRSGAGALWPLITDGM